MRIGHGYDVHAFETETGRPLVLGGVHIPGEAGLKAHSDGDVVIHALCDALIGAAALGDIGRLFPDSSSEFKNIDSRILLRDVVSRLRQRQLIVHNVDLTIVAQKPRLSGHVQSMAGILAMDLAVAPDAVNVKATTTEHLGFVGRKEGIASYAVALLEEVI